MRRNASHGLGWRLGMVLLLIVPLEWGGWPSHGMAEYADVVLNNQAEKEGMRPVIYPHWFHRIRFRCKVCHSELGFEMRAGANNINMADIMDGKYCGMCHNGEIAWSLEHCHRCHSGLPGLDTGIIGGHKSTGPGNW